MAGLNGLEQAVDVALFERRGVSNFEKLVSALDFIVELLQSFDP